MSKIKYLTFLTFLLYNKFTVKMEDEYEEEGIIFVYSFYLFIYFPVKQQLNKKQQKIKVIYIYYEIKRYCKLHNKSQCDSYR